MDEQTNDLDNLREDASLLPGPRKPLECHLSAYPTFTVRSTVVGLLIGVVVCLSNVYFGLQNGYSNTLAMPSSLLGYAIFRLFRSQLKRPFTSQENAFVQTVAGAVGAMPLTAGLVSVIAALEYLIQPSEGGPLSFSWARLVIWSLGLCFFGMTFTMLLRRQFLEQEDLPFPSATASAMVIKALHKPGPATVTNTSSDQGDLLEPGDSQDTHLESGGRESSDISSADVVNMTIAFTVSGVMVCDATMRTHSRTNADGSRLLFRPSCLFYTRFPFSVRSWHTTGFGLSIFPQGFSAKE